MNIFLIYPFLEKEFVEKIILTNKDVKFDRLHAKYDFTWKFFSNYKIKKADYIILIAGKIVTPNMLSEIQTAISYGKKIFKIEIYENVAHCTEINTLKDISKNDLTNIKNKIEEIINNEFELCLYNKNNDFSKRYFDASLSQYKLMLQTSEALVTRRQNMNKFYLTSNGILISSLGIITQQSINYAGEYVFILFIISALGILLSISWIKMIISYGQVNSAKFKIINTIEKQLPLAIFNTEWEILGNGKDKARYLSFTKAEKFFPKTFFIMYMLCILFWSIYLLLKYFSVIQKNISFNIFIYIH